MAKAGWIVPGLFFALLAGIAFSAPMPEEYIINNATMECAVFWGGDECLYCDMPVGWKSIGLSHETECPDGYAEISLKTNCTQVKDSFCCTESHSGGPGNCDGMIISHFTRECALLDNISACAVPAGWSSANGLCPPDYEWVDVSCGERENGNLPCLSTGFICIMLACRVFGG